jgi:hypothetical protein
MTLDLELVAFSKLVLRGGPGEQNSETGRKPVLLFLFKIRFFTFIDKDI